MATPATLPLPALPSLHGPRPTLARMREFFLALNSMAIDLTSTGNGHLGHLALTLAPERYAIQAGNVQFVVPVNPGVHPVHPANATGPQITEINRAHKANHELYIEYTDANVTLKKAVRTAVPDTMIHALSDAETGFANVTVLQIVELLHAKFPVTGTALRTNRNVDLRRTWNPATDSIDTVWANTTTVRAIAAAGGDPITDASAQDGVLEVLEQTGQFGTAIHEWHNKPAADKTYANLVLHFDQADARRLELLTSRTAGFHGNALLAADGTTPPTEQALLAPGGAPPALAPPAAPARTPQLYYCHTHGLSTSAAHTSMTCRSRGPGHDTTATVFNMKGGCNLIQRRRNEKIVWTAPTPRTPAPAQGN